MQFAQAFKKLCKEKGVTQSQALADMELSRNATQKWRTCRPSADNLKKISDYFGVSVDFLLGNEKNPATDNGNGMSKAKADIVNRVMQMSDAELEKLKLLLQIVESK